MNYVCTECWEEGNCSLEDMMVVMTNVGEEILGIVASLALLLFVVGGMYWLFSQGQPARIQKGKNFMKGAVVGILIVFAANLMIQSAYHAIRHGTIAGGSSVFEEVEEESEVVIGEEEPAINISELPFAYVLCNGNNDGYPCAYNAECLQGICHSQCWIRGNTYRTCQPEDHIYLTLPEYDCVRGTNLCSDPTEYCCDTNPDYPL